MLHCFGRLAATAALALTAGSALADTATGSVGLDYKIYIGGLEALAATTTITADPARYRIEIHATTGGRTGKLFPWSVVIDSKGNVTGDKLQPVQHSQTSNFQGKDRAVFLDYDGQGGFLDRRVVPENNQDERDDVPADMTRDTMDVVSAILAGLRNVGRTGGCDGKQPVFDGRRRFDLAFCDEGREMMKPGDIAIFGGEAVRCSIKAFVAPVGAAGIMAPVRIESTSAFGALVLHLTGIHDNPAPAVN